MIAQFSSGSVFFVSLVCLLFVIAIGIFGMVMRPIRWCERSRPVGETRATAWPRKCQIVNGSGMDLVRAIVHTTIFG